MTIQSKHPGCRSGTYRFLNTTVPNPPICVSNVLAQYARNAHQLMIKAGYPGIQDVSVLFETADPDSENLKITALVQYTQSLLSQALREHDFNDLANPLDRSSTVHDIYNQAAYIGFGPDAAAYYAHHRHLFKAAQLLSHAATFASALIEISQQADPTEPCPHCNSNPVPLPYDHKEDVKYHTHAITTFLAKAVQHLAEDNPNHLPQSLHLNALNAAIKPSP